MSKSIKKVCIILMALFAFVASVFAINSMTTVRADVTGGTTDAIVMDTKAQVRLDDIETADKDETGMRFFINVDSKKVDGILANYQGYSVEYGVALLPAKFLDGGELDVEGTYIYNQKEREVLKIKLTNGIENDGIISFKAVLTDIPTLEYETDVAARAYIKLTKADSTIYLQSETSTSKAIGEIATSYYNDVNSGMDEEEKAYYESLLTANIGTLSFDKQEYVLFKNAVNTKTVTEDFKVYGNKYGFEIDLNSDFAKENNLQITFGTEGVASYDGNTFVPVSRGTTTVSVTLAGKTATATIKVETEEDLKATLATNEIAAYDHKGYATMVDEVVNANGMVMGILSEVSVGNYHGKEGVLKVAGTIEGGTSLVKLSMPTMEPWKAITIQIYVEQGNVGGNGSLGVSAAENVVSWGDGSLPLYSGRLALGQWENVSFFSVHANTIYFALSPETTDAGSYFTYYISTIMLGDQKVALATADADALANKTTLADTEVASFDNKDYLNLVQTNHLENVSMEVLDEYDGKKGVLHMNFISYATGLGTSNVEIYLPKAINSKLTMEYQVKINQTAGAVYDSNVWGFLGASWGTLFGNANVTTWTKHTEYGWAGSKMIKLAFNQWDPSVRITFDLYISTIETDVNAANLRAQYKGTLAGKLESNEFANYNEDAYKWFAEGNADFVDFTTEVVDDATFGRKVLKISGTTAATYNGLIYLYTPKAIAENGTFSFNYRFESASVTVEQANVFGLRVNNAGVAGAWYSLKGGSELEGTFQAWEAAGYAGCDKIIIGINAPSITFSLYISTVFAG